MTELVTGVLPPIPRAICLCCGQYMRHNVPRLGAEGGWTHDKTSSPLCLPEDVVQANTFLTCRKVNDDKVQADLYDAKELETRRRSALATDLARILDEVRNEYDVAHIPSVDALLELVKKLRMERELTIVQLMECFEFFIGEIRKLTLNESSEKGIQGINRRIAVTLERMRELTPKCSLLSVQKFEAKLAKL